MHKLYLWSLFSVCTGHHRRSEPRTDEYVSSVQCYGLDFQAVSVGLAVTSMDLQAEHEVEMMPLAARSLFGISIISMGLAH